MDSNLRQRIEQEKKATKASRREDKRSRRERLQELIGRRLKEPDELPAVSTESPHQSGLIDEQRDFLQQSKERTGAVNCYSCKAGHVTPVILLASCVTPFMIGCPRTGCTLPAQSSFYRVSIKGTATILHAWYRPSVEAFDKLDAEMQQWVLDGHGLFAGIYEATSNTLCNDTFDTFKKWEEAKQYLVNVYRDDEIILGGEDDDGPDPDPILEPDGD